MFRVVLFLAFTVIVTVNGCATMGGFPNATMLPNPIFVAANNEEAVWERVIDVLHSHKFQIGRENKLDGVIETEYKVGAGLLEPWHSDSVGFESRLESSLQSMRRRAIIHVSRIEDGSGYLVGVEVFKELEDLTDPPENSPGPATFPEHSPLKRNLDVVVGGSVPSGWIAQGRDPSLEQMLLNSLRARLQH